MDFYNVIRTCLAWFATVACLYPLNIPWLFFAYRINEGSVEEDKQMESDELWKRAGLAGFVLAVLTAAFIVLDALLAQWLDFPAEIIHPVIFLAYPPAAVALLTVFFSFDDAVAAFFLFMIYLFGPLVVLGGLNWLFPFWTPLLNFAYPWLKEIPQGASS